MLQVSFRLKNADITPSFKRGDRNLKDNYRPVSISSIISKIFNDAFLTHYEFYGAVALKIPMWVQEGI